MKKRFFLFALPAIGALFSLPVAAQTYAITNARIVTVSGAPIENGTVVVRDGLIESVGANAKAPADAQIFNGSGLTVYPGFIDALTSVGMAATPARPAGGGQAATQTAQTAATNSNYPNGLQPEQAAVEMLKAGEAQFEANRNAGFTTVVTVGRDGIFNGQSAVINLAGENVSDMVVKAPFAEHVSFNTLRGQYPGSLLGTFSALKQMMLDAQRLQEMQKIYQANPVGIRRPAEDKSLQALIPVLNREVPIVFNANREIEIIRALDLAKQFNLRAIIAGGQEAHKVADRLKAQNVPVLLSLNYPKRTAAASPEADAESLEILRLRAETPKTAARLQQAGVKFAFQSGGATSVNDFYANAGMSVENGLAKDAAIRAMTLGTAEILGIENRTGSIEKGKIANLTVVRGDILGKEKTITHVFVDGKLFEQKEKPRTPAQTAGATTPGARTPNAPATTPAIASVGGNYSITIDIPGQPVSGTLAFTQQSAILSGSMQTQFGTSVIKDGKVTAEGFSFSTTVEFSGSTIEIFVKGTVSGDQISGSIDSPQGAVPFSGNKKSVIKGKLGETLRNKRFADKSQLTKNMKKQTTLFLKILFCTILTAFYVSAQTPKTEVLIRNATVLTAARGTLTETDILIQNGKIARIGKDLKTSANAQTIDATGKFVSPGIIDAHSHTMLDAINEISSSVTSMTNVRDVLNPTDISIYRALAGGVTTANLLHGSANPIGGQNTVVRYKYGRPVEEFVFPGAPMGIKFALGENPKRIGANPQPGQTPRYPITRMGTMEVIRDAFLRARDYKQSWDEYRAKVAKKDKTAVPPRRNLELEPMVEILEGKRLVHAHGYRSDEHLNLLLIADEFGFKVRTLQHALEAYKIAPEVARRGTGASVFADSWSYKLEAYDSIPYNAAILWKNGVLVSINSDSDERARRLNLDAAKTMKYGGVPEEEALKMITLNPAKQLGVDHRTGSIEQGKDADIVIWSAHPFSVYAHPEMTMIEGVTYFDRTKDMQKRAELAREREALEKMDINKAPGTGGTSPRVPSEKRIEERDEADQKDGGNY